MCHDNFVRRHRPDAASTLCGTWGEYDPAKKQCSVTVANPENIGAARAAGPRFHVRHGFEYPDGHIQELSYMDMGAMPGD